MRVRRGWAWPLVPVYWAVAGLAARLRRVHRLAWPVVSVGSLSAGGAGKTPVAIALAKLLEERGWAVDVLSRGYGRSGKGVERVEGEAVGAAERFGDEPVLMARRGVTVWVGADRFAAGLEAEAATSEGGLLPSQTIPHPSAQDAEGWATQVGGVRRVHLLDDGFQHRRLARAVDVVLVTAEDLEDCLLPAGNLREGLGALRRADAVVVREEERGLVEARVRHLVREGTAMWVVRRELRLPEAWETSAGARPMAFCAIARPEGFAQMLGQAGCEVVDTVAFGDHHGYGEADIATIVKAAKDRKATALLTTEKDAVKLSEAMLERLRAVGPVLVVGLDAMFVDEAAVVRELEARIA